MVWKHGKFRPVGAAAGAAIMLAAMVALVGLAATAYAQAAQGQEAAPAGANLSRASFVEGPFLVAWQAGHGTTITYRGVPLFAANPGEFIVHQHWQKVFYRSSDGGERASVRSGDGQRVLEITEKADHFVFTKRVIAGDDGTLRIEYAYELPAPDEAGLQVLFGIGNAWIDKSHYRIVVDRKPKEGELTVPASGRTDPWQGATEQVFTTNYGTLTINSERPLNLLCRPSTDSGSALWWAQDLKRGEKYRQVIEVKVKPGKAVDTGVALTSLAWTQTVRSGDAHFGLELGRTAGGPAQVKVWAEPTGGGGGPAGRAVTAALGEKPTRVECAAPVGDVGALTYAVVVADAASGKDLLRLDPLMVNSAPLLRIFPRLSYYTSENTAEIVADVADDLDLDGLSLQLAVRKGGAGAPVEPLGAAVRPTAHRVLLPLDVTGLPEGTSEVLCQLTQGGQVMTKAETSIEKLPPKPNEVKIDNLSRSLIVDGLPYVPFGYYTYYPLAKGVMDEEVVRGFNLFSPYHGGPHDAAALKSIRAYMDHCAAIGMKVNYHLIWTNNPKMTSADWAALRTEVEAFRDHPALLSWYIADEPSAGRADHLTQVYNFVKKLDPYHPVAIVFYRGAAHAKLFSKAMDIVMVDPYPIPNLPVTMVSGAADSIDAAFGNSKPLWVVPQAFGGNEGWRREPTAREERVMTYLALIHGARGIQYFVRKPRVSFPKSPAAWAECGDLSLETAELTPWLTSDEEAPKVTSSLPAVNACALKSRGVVVIMAVNTDKSPQVVRLKLEGVHYTGPAKVMFEDRTVEVTDGAIEEPIDGYGRRVYAVPVGPMPKQDLSVDPNNLTVNPSWEDDPQVGTGAGCYANVPEGGATMFVDSRVARQGRHSLRLIAPTAETAPSFGPFPVQLDGGKEYRVSIWAKSAAPGVGLSVSCGELGSKQFDVTPQWQEFSWTAKADKGQRVGPQIAMKGAGTMWLDLFQIVPVAGGAGESGGK